MQGTATEVQPPVPVPGRTLGGVVAQEGGEEDGAVEGRA